MENRNFKKTSISLIIPMSLIGTLFAFPHKTNVKADAYTIATLPTTIDLNDSTDSEIRNYYSNLDSLSTSQRSGTNLLKNLKTILKTNQKYYSYDSNNDRIWSAYEITDRDWTLSPASSISGYNASTNKISNYSYGSGTDPYVHALYVDRNVTNQMHARANHQQTSWGINREHIWPKSRGFEAEGAGGARGDLMHLWAADGLSNNLHSNYSYGYVDKTKSYDVPNGISYASNNLKGISKTLGSGTVFEPQDSDKGDIARAMFYMAARYNNYDGDTNIDSNNPSLRLTSSASVPSSFTSTTSNPGECGIIADLLEWNKLDPVDEYEIHRNNLLFKNYTNNRNPFIDFPQWADLIWGNKSGNASPSTDSINDISTVTLTSISVDTLPTKTTYTEGESFNPSGMVVTAHYSNNTTSTLTSSDYTYTPSGLLTTSNTTITVNYQGFSASFNITVQSNGSSVGTEEETISSCVFATSSWGITNDTSPSMWTSGKPGNGFTANQGVQVTSGASGANATTRNSFSNVKKIVVHYCTNSSKGKGSINLKVGNTVFDNAFTVSPIGTTVREKEFNSSTGMNGTVKIEVTCTENSIYIYGIDIYEYLTSSLPTLQSISISGTYPTAFTVNDAFSTSGMVVTAHYSDSTTANVTSDCTFTGYDMSQTGNQTITVSYQGVTATYVITVGQSIKSYSLCGGTLLDGDYIIAFPVDNAADGSLYTLSNGLDSKNRFTYKTLYDNNGVVNNTDNDVVWHISSSGDYFTIQNKSNSTYLSTTGENKVGAFLSSASTDKSKWSITAETNADKYAVINKYNSENGASARLSSNTTYGFAPYAYGEEKDLNFYRLDDTSFVQATMVNQISAGDRITITATKNSVNYKLDSYSSSNGHYTGSTLSVSSKGLYKYADDQLLCFNVVTNGDHYGLQNDLGYLKYVANSDQNLKFEQSLSQNSSFDFVVLNNALAIKCTSADKYLLFNENTGNARFKFYGSTYSSINIYQTRLTGEAKKWAASFLEQTNNCDISNWDTLKNAYNALSSTSRNLLVNSYPNINGNIIEQALARYEYIWNDSRYDVLDFIYGLESSSSPVFKLNIFDNDGSLVKIIVVCALVGITCIGCYFFVSKHRSDDKDE